jgi:hypothetical protein
MVHIIFLSGGGSWAWAAAFCFGLLGLGVNLLSIPLCVLAFWCVGLMTGSPARVEGLKQGEVAEEGADPRPA